MHVVLVGRSAATIQPSSAADELWLSALKSSIATIVFGSVQLSLEGCMHSRIHIEDSRQHGLASMARTSHRRVADRNFSGGKMILQRLLMQHPMHVNCNTPTPGSRTPLVKTLAIISKRSDARIVMQNADAAPNSLKLTAAPLYCYRQQKKASAALSYCVHMRRTSFVNPFTGLRHASNRSNMRVHNSKKA